MVDKPSDKTTPGPLRALSDWLKRGSSAPSPDRAGARADGTPSRIAHYAIVRKLGEGGMGIVYEARDERLERAVALKTMSLPGDEEGRKRFWREARAAASVNHPNICQLYEIGEDRGEPFIAMELLEGEALADRLQRGAMSVPDTLPIGLSILAALSALHARGIVHRDLKPSNVFLTPHGVKLLDFGLARPAGPDVRALGSMVDLTRTGMVLGTPRYMAPEQMTGESLDARGDLFAAGAILFEMLAGRPAFSGRNVVEILHATMHEQPPALTGSPAVAAMDRVIRHALAKRPADRPPSAEVMAEELRAVRGSFGEDTPALARALTRLVVLPFRVLRSDPETDFLAFSLPDAIATSLTGFGSLVVRSSATAARFGAGTPDLKALAAEADVDRVVMGTLLRAGDQVRATAQLVEAPAGTLLTSHTVESSLGDLFRLQDDIARRVVDALALPLGGGGSPPTPDAPRDAGAYGLYLRANELARGYDTMQQARDLYQRCIELDPNFAPAWAQLGRCHTVIGKYIDGTGDTGARAEASVRRALELNPRLAVAHKIYAQIESDAGNSRGAMQRLLGQASRLGNDPELFTGLVHACRYAGLFEQSIAAHAEARRLDPTSRTSMEQTVLMTCDLDRLLSVGQPTGGGGDGDSVIRIIGLGLAGRHDEARTMLMAMRAVNRITAFESWSQFILAWLDRRVADMGTHRAALGPLKIMDDPEAIFQEGWLFADAGDLDRGLERLQRAVRKGYFVSVTLATSPSFDGLRERSEFQELLREASAGRDRSLEAFREGGGERLLGR